MRDLCASFLPRGCGMKERRSYSRTGLNALKARVKIRGLVAIDKRTAAAQALIAWRNELLADLGGEESVSATQMALVDIAIRTRLYVDSLDACIMEQESLVKMTRLSCHRFRSNEVRLWLSIIAYNLGNLWRRRSYIRSAFVGV